MFCVECGKETDIYKNGVCIDCYLKTHSFTSGPEIIDMTVCTNCGSYKYKNTWTKEILGDFLRRMIKNHFKISNELQKTDINTEYEETKNGLQCKVYISGYINDHMITEEHPLDVRFKKTICDVCSKQYGGYHEAIIQVRTQNRKLPKDELQDIQKTVENQVEDLQAKGNRQLFITDIGEEHGGIDFYISDKQVAMVITKKLHEKYGGIIKQSSKNIGMKDSRQIYRMTYLLRLPSYKKNDVIKHQNRYYLVNSVNGNKVKIMNIANWDETFEDADNLQTAKIIGGKELIKEKIIVSQTKKEIQIMDPETYQIKIIKKPKPIQFNSEKIKTIKIDEQIFILK